MKHYLLNPFGEQNLLQNKIFESPYRLLKDMLKKKNIVLDTYDLGDLAKADKVLSFNYHQSFMDLCQKAGLPKKKLILFLNETEVVMPDQYNKQIWEKFDKVFTFRDDLVDHHRFFKLRFPQGQAFMATLPSYAKRNFLTLINANRYSYVKNELYSLRRQAIRSFDDHAGFDLYGHRWDDHRVVVSPRNVTEALRRGKILPLLANIVSSAKPYQSYRGSIDDKYATLARYRFCLCFENEQDAPGYITEKIFDCFFTGTVPIYLGASNITDYVPKESFIDMRNFANFSQLNSYLTALTPKQWQAFHRSGQAYIRSKQFLPWRPKGAFKEICDNL